MKELSIEQKAKQYDEAIERAKKVLLDCTPEEQKVVEYIYPELAESEDERIRNLIYCLIRDRSDNGKLLEHNGCSVEKALTWLEKQGEKNPVKFKPSFRVGDVIKPKDPLLGEQRIIEGIHPKWGYDTNNGILDFEFEDNWELVEQKPVDKVEPKFKVGDWIKHNKANIICKIVSVNRGSYYMENIETNSRIEFFHAEQNFHLWTIQDAKDGDVLVASDGSIFLFAGVVDYACKYYVALTTDNYVKINKEVEASYWETSRAAHPATKEQRDFLFQKMKEVGYEWDTDKKELLKRVLLL